MRLIFESRNFFVEAPQQPKVHVDRRDGGHIKISPKVAVQDRTELSIDQARELIVLTMVVGEAFALAMRAVGIPLGRVNYQDNGNFNNTFHLHLYGRAEQAPKQVFGTVLQFPPMEADFLEVIKNNEALTDGDIALIYARINDLLLTDKYKNEI